MLSYYSPRNKNKLKMSILDRNSHTFLWLFSFPLLLFSWTKTANALFRLTNRFYFHNFCFCSSLFASVSILLTPFLIILPVGFRLRWELTRCLHSTLGNILLLLPIFPIMHTADTSTISLSLPLFLSLLFAVGCCWSSILYYRTHLYYQDWFSWAFEWLMCVFGRFQVRITIWNEFHFWWSSRFLMPSAISAQYQYIINTFRMYILIHSIPYHSHSHNIR